VKDKKFVFAVGRNAGEKLGFVASFARQPDDHLKLINQQSSMGEGPCHLSLDADSKNLFVANYASGSVASYQVDEAGKISPAVSFHQHKGSSVHPERQTQAHAHSIYCTSDNKFVYAADLGTDKVMIYALDAASGKLTPSGEASVPAGGGARHMVFSDDGKKLYVLNELTLSVSRFGRDEKSGELKLEITKPVMANIGEEMTCSEIQLSADGKFLYAASRDIANKKRDVISVLKVEDLSIIQEQPTGAWIPRHFGISPCGKWMLIAGMRENKVVVHALDPSTGKLMITPHSVEMELPMWILFP
jgi:6-phosphogluconolactonase